MRLANKVVIITGSTSGIGRAIAERCLREGASVLVHGLDAKDGPELLAALGERARFVAADLVDPASAPRLVEAAVAAFGKIDAVVNNAAAIVRSNLHNTKPEFFDRVMAVNVRAPLFLIQAAFAELKKTQGCVLNIGSINSLSGESELLDYSISKGALQTLSRNLANAHGEDKVRVNHFNLGWVLSPNEYALQRRLGQPEDWPQRVPKTYAPSGRLIVPEEIAAAAIYWIGDESRPISGSVVDLEQYSFYGRNPLKS